MIIYQIGPTGLLAGLRVIDDGAGIPPGWTADAPPSAGAGQVAVHTPAGWVVAPAPVAVDPGALADQVAAQALEDAREARRADLDVVEAAAYAAIPCPLPPVNGLTLQLRDADDKTNWDIFYGICNEGVAAGAGDLPAPQAIRTAENVNLTATFAEGQAIMRWLRAKGGQLMSNRWRLDDEITASADPPTVDISTGWS